MLGEFFAARADEVDDAVVEDGPSAAMRPSKRRPSPPSASRRWARFLGQGLTTP
jgi:hypothetical protein